MGVLNVTPDSFSDGGRYVDPEVAVAHAMALVEAGADIVDVGGESTRPGSEPVSPEEQKRRVLPVINALARTSEVPVSIDTTSAQVAASALAAGASFVNDISAFRFDEAMLGLLAESGAPAIAMHTLAPPRTMQRSPDYADVVAEVRDHLAERLRACEAAGVDPAQILVDPGIGFGKTVAHNLALLRHLDTLVELGRPVLVGTSNKSFLGHLTGRAVGERLMGTAASNAVAIALGAHVVRVHEVAAVMDAVRVADAIARGPESV